MTSELRILLDPLDQMQEPQELPARPILGTPVVLTDYRGAFECVSAWAKLREQPRLVDAANTHVVTMARQRRSFYETMSRFDLVLPDGMPLVWVLNRRYRARLEDRVYGPTLMERVFDWSQEPGHGHLRHYLLGSSDQIREKASETLSRRFPAAVIDSGYSPPFGGWDANEDRAILDRIADSGANLIWVGFGCPKQEEFLARLRPRLPAGVYLAVGAAFAFHAGSIPQAPKWLQRIGMEWSFRLLMEPRRLYKRYLLYNSLFVFYLLRDGLFGRPNLSRG